MCLAPILTTTLHILGSAVCKQGLVAEKFLFASEFLDSYAAKLLHATVLTLFSRNVIMMMRTHHFCAAFQYQCVVCKETGLAYADLRRFPGSL